MKGEIALEIEDHRRVPKIPEKGERIKIIIDSDCKNEIDDQWAIALAILSPERFEIEGFIGANFDQGRYGADCVKKSVIEIKKILNLSLKLINNSEE